MRATLFLATVIATLSLAAAAIAQDATANRETCMNEVGTSAQIVTACTALIQSGALASYDLESAFVDRAFAYEKQDDHVRAITDFSEGIQLDPQDKENFIHRGVVYAFGQKDYGRAIIDFNAALRLDPQYAEAFYFRGLKIVMTGRQSHGCPVHAGARSRVSCLGS